MSTNEATEHSRLIAEALARQANDVDNAAASPASPPPKKPPPPNNGQKEYIRILQEQVRSLEEKVRRLRKQLKEKDEKILNLEEEIGWMDDDKLDKLRAAKNKREEEKKKEEEEKAKHIPEHVFWTFFSKFAGFNRYYLLSDEWHAANSTAANQLFGFKSWTEAKETAKEKFPSMDFTPPQIYKVQKKKGDPYLELRECSEFEQCFAVKMMDRTGMTSRRAALLYGRDYRTVVRWRQKWIKKWGLPAYNSGMDDDDGVGGKPKQGAARPFQSRQMINPVKRKRPPVPEEEDDEPDSDEDDNEDDEDDPDQLGIPAFPGTAPAAPVAKHSPNLNPRPIANPSPFANPAPAIPNPAPAMANPQSVTNQPAFTNPPAFTSPHSITNPSPMAATAAVPMNFAGFNFADVAGQLGNMAANVNVGTSHLTLAPQGIVAEEPAPLPAAYDYLAYPPDNKRPYIRGYF